MMKVLHINVNYTTNVLHSVMINHLEKEGVKNDVFVPVAYTDSYECESENIIVSKCFSRLDRLNFYGKQKKIFSSLIKKYDIKKYDCVHAYTVFTDGNIAYELNKRYSVPYVVAVRNTDVNIFFKYMPYLRKRGVEVMRNASAVFFLSEKYKERTFDNYIPKKLADEIEKKTFVIPNGIDPFWIEQPINKKVDRSCINVICAGAIDKNKNMLSIAKALENIKRQGKDVRLNIAGQVKNKKIFDRLQKYEFVKYHGKLCKEQLCRLYEKNDVFALASFHETFGMVYIEAMSRGLPVIYTKNEGFDGQFEDGIVGFAVNPLDISSIAEKILLSYKERVKIEDRCICCVKNYAWSEIVKKYIKIYNSISKRKKCE